MSLMELAQEKRYGQISGIAELFDIIKERVYSYCRLKELAHEDEYRLLAEYMTVFMNYASWCRPDRWQIDHLEDDGAFGIFLVGEYCCLVMLRSNGTVTGHS